MRAVCWNGKKDVRVETVPDPEIINPRDAIIKTELTAICGSDLHLYNGNIPTMKAGDILGHEFLGEVVEVGRGVSNLQIGRPSDRAVPYRVRQLLLLCARIIFFLRQLQSERRINGNLLRPTGRRQRRPAKNRQPSTNLPAVGRSA